MYMPCVTATQPICCPELDFKAWNKDNAAKTKAGKEAKGITTAYLKPILRKIAKAARKKLGPGPITFVHDKAPAYTRGLSRKATSVASTRSRWPLGRRRTCRISIPECAHSWSGRWRMRARRRQRKCERLSHARGRKSRQRYA
eukprot:347782-Prymnesium_polylepis.1